MPQCRSAAGGVSSLARIALALSLAAIVVPEAQGQSQPPGCYPYVLQVQVATSQHPGPIPEINCPPPPALPCVATAAPTVDFQLGEEARLTANASLEDDTGVADVVEARMVVQKKNEYGGFDHHYTVTTTDATQLGYMRVGSSQDFRFGVPGIDKDGEYRAHVAFCYSFQNPPASPRPNRFCECQSDTVSLTPASTGWQALSPAPAKNAAGTVMTRQGEDDFRRPQTVGKKNQSGASLGGNGVSPTNKPWIDEFSLPAANGTTIASDGESARMLQGMVLVYYEEAKGKTQYADAFVYKAADDPGSVGNYNFDVEARLVVSGSTSKAYAVKLTKGHVGPVANRDKHMLYVADTTVINALDAGQTSSGGESLDVASSEGCGAIPPLSGAGSSNTTLLRIVVENVAGRANVTGWVAWDCPLDANGLPQDISMCGRKCSKTWEDLDNALLLFNVQGQVGFTAHEHTYQVPYFKFGYVPGS